MVNHTYYNVAVSLAFEDAKYAHNVGRYMLVS